MLTIFISIGQISGTAIIGLLLASLAGRAIFESIFAGVAVLLLLMFLASLGLSSCIIPIAVSHEA